MASNLAINPHDLRSLRNTARSGVSGRHGALRFPQRTRNHPPSSGFSRSLGVGLTVILAAFLVAMTFLPSLTPTVSAQQGGSGTANSAPTASFVSPADNSWFNATDTITFTFDLADADGDPLTWEVSALYLPYYNGGQGSYSTYTIGSGSGAAGQHTASWSPGGALSGSFMIKVLVNDGTYYGVDYLYNITLVGGASPNSAPTVSVTYPAAGGSYINYGYGMPIYFTVNDVDGDFLTWDVTAYTYPGSGAYVSYPVTNGSGYSGFQYTYWTPPTSGTFNFYFTVSDGASSGYGYVWSVTITAYNPNNTAPQITATYPYNNSLITNYGYGTAIYFNLNDADGDLMNWNVRAYYNPYYNNGSGTWAMYDVANGSNYNGFQYVYWNPATVASGTYYFILTANDGQNYGYSYIWNVTINNRPTVDVYYPLNNSVWNNYGYGYGVPISFNLNDHDGDAMTYSITAYYHPYYNGGQGNWTSYTVANGTSNGGFNYVYWNVSNVPSGSYYLIVSVSDGLSYGSAYIWNFTINNVPQASFYYPAANSQVTNYGTVPFTFDLQDADGDLMDWELTAYYYPYYNNGSGNFTIYNIGSGTGASNGYNYAYWNNISGLYGNFYVTLRVTDGKGYGYDTLWNVSLVAPWGGNTPPTV